MKKSLREWYEYLTEEEKHNILLLSEKCFKDIDDKIFDSLADAIMESGDWDKGLNLPLITDNFLKENLNTSTVYFHALYNKYLHKSLEEIMQMNNYYVNLNLLIKETLNNI
jgi:hypothetical protein